MNGEEQTQEAEFKLKFEMRNWRKWKTKTKKQQIKRTTKFSDAYLKHHHQHYFKRLLRDRAGERTAGKHTQTKRKTKETRKNEKQCKGEKK